MISPDESMKEAQNASAILLPLVFSGWRFRNIVARGVGGEEEVWGRAVLGACGWGRDFRWFF